MPTKLPHITDDHHFAIANVAGRAAQMEYHIETTVAAGLERLPKTAEFLLKNFSLDRIVGLLKTILLDTFPNEETQIKDLMKTIAELRTDRNEILHWTWIPGFKPDSAIATSSRPFREFRYNDLSAEQIQEYADQMLTVSHALKEWKVALQKLPVQASPDKP